jgi:hypothetical protein
VIEVAGLEMVVLLMVSNLADAPCGTVKQAIDSYVADLTRLIATQLLRLLPIAV